MPAKTTEYTARSGRTYRITYDIAKIVTTAIEYTYTITLDGRQWTSFYGISQTAASNRNGAKLISTLSERGLQFLCAALDKGDETPFRAIEQKDGSKYFKKLA